MENHTSPNSLKDTMLSAFKRNFPNTENTHKSLRQKKVKHLLVNVFLIVLSALGLNLPAKVVKAETVFLKGTAYQSGIAPKDIKVGTSEIIVSNAPIKRVAVTDPAVANVRVLSDTSALVMGRKVGKTTLLIWEGKDASVRPSRFDITVKRDISDLIASLKLIDPNIQIDYVMVPASSIQQASPSNSNGAYTTSFRTQPETVGDPAPSIVINNASSDSGGSGGGNATALAPLAGGGGTERIILTGKVRSPDVIAKAFTIASTYMGVDSNMKIVTRQGGVIVDQVSGLLSESDAGGSSTGSQSLNTPTKFTSNLKGNLGNGGIIANGDGSILSFLEVTDRPQISVMIRFYEVSRSVGKDFSSRIAFAPGNTQKSGIYGFGAGGKLGGFQGTQTISSNFSTGGQTPNGNSLTNSANVTIPVTAGSPGTFFSLFPKQELSVQLQALESRGEVKLLAEPNIVVMSGEPGKFVAGGEVPIQQAVSTLGAIGQQVSFETFGISLNILPTITDSDSILMNVVAQTRDLDTANPFIPPGSSLPAFRTRRADTQVEMDPNNALIIGGLINASSSNNLSKVPFIGDIPILGVLARSKSFARNDSELVIVLSPEIVRAAHPSQVIKPLALDASPRPEQFDYIPRSMDLSKTSIPIAAPPGMTPRDPVDLSRPATVNDLDHLYK